jgi:Fe-S-cluster-containing hydrogenase component 2
VGNHNLVTKITEPLDSLKQGNWFKLICGASYQHLPAIRNLTITYTLAGADCIDVAADKAVINAATEGIKIAESFREEAQQRGYHPQIFPYLMVSINDGEDPHFRKAEFNSSQCPSSCPRPCEQICPAEAIKFTNLHTGVIDGLCYGCGRCVPVCPGNLIYTRSYGSTPTIVASWLPELSIEALEIHTQVGHEGNFQRLWQAITPKLSSLKLLAISCPYAPGVIDYLQRLYEQISPLPRALIWQTDGRPMSGDIGIGTTHLAIKFARQVLNSNLPGYVQLAGGTNQYTVAKLRALGLLPPNHSHSGQRVSGVAYGSYGRKLLTEIWTELDQISTSNQLEKYPHLLWKAVEKANFLVSQLKAKQLSRLFSN